MRLASLRSAQSGASATSLAGLTFVITGETDEYQGDTFGSHCRGVVEACGGRVTSAISGVTDYLIAGTVHYNPFLGTRGPIENGSKYKKAVTMNKCKIVDLEFIEGLVDGSMTHED